jgi:hypothetical protein
MLVESISRLLPIDHSLGIAVGHGELTAFVEQYLRQLEPAGETATGLHVGPAGDPPDGDVPG